MIAIACALAWRWSLHWKECRLRAHKLAGAILDFGIGIGIYFRSNGVRTDNLALDSAKGAILIFSNYLNDRFG